LFIQQGISEIEHRIVAELGDLDGLNKELTMNPLTLPM